MTPKGRTGCGSQFASNEVEHEVRVRHSTLPSAVRLMMKCQIQRHQSTSRQTSNVCGRESGSLLPDGLFTFGVSRMALTISQPSAATLRPSPHFPCSGTACSRAAAQKGKAARGPVRRDRDNDRPKRLLAYRTNAKPTKTAFPRLAWGVRQNIHQDALDTKGSFREGPPGAFSVCVTDLLPCVAVSSRMI